MNEARIEPIIPVTEIFAGLSPEQRALISASLETVPVRRGAVLVREGDAADALYVVASGRFAVTRAGRDGVVAEIGAEQPVGEIAFLTGGRRTATVTAMRDGLVLKLTRPQFDDITARHPSILKALLATLAHRLAETTSAVARGAASGSPAPRVICLIRAGGSPLPDEFRARFAAALARHTRTLVVDGATAGEILGADPVPGNAQATSALNALEQRFRYVLLIADPDLTPWSEKAMRHADLIIAAGRHDASETPNVLERRVAKFVSADQRRLVLLHDRKTRVSGTARWLAARAIAMHHHAALDRDDDIERLIRFIDGSAVGLVACGGGALCAAHTGVYRALAEFGVRFDIMGGTSAGSALVAAFVEETPIDEIDRAIHDMFVTRKAMHRYTWPRYSLLDHANFDAQLQRYFGGRDIEDLWLPYFAVSTNLSRYRVERHTRGPMWRAIRASSSIPVLLPPVYTADGEMLVDGCLLDNVPLGEMQAMKRGPNVVVSFLVPELQRFAVDYDALPTRAALMRLALNPLRKDALPDAPGLIAVLMRSLMANRRDFKADLRQGDLLLVPPVTKASGFLDWPRHSALLDEAYWWTRDELARRSNDLAALAASGRS